MTLYPAEDLYIEDDDLYPAAQAAESQEAQVGDQIAACYANFRYGYFTWGRQAAPD